MFKASLLALTILLSLGVSANAVAQNTTTQQSTEVRLQLAQADKYYESKQYEKAFAIYKPLAEQGDAQAQYNLGKMYAKGQGVDQDYAKANELFKKAAEQGVARAQYNLGIMYYKGLGVSKDNAKANKLFKKAAEQGVAKAQYALGIMYYDGLGVKEDDAEAAKWYKKACEQGNQDACSSLKSINTQQQIAKINEYYGAGKYGKAFAILKSLAEQGNSRAQYGLGVMYYEGKGVQQDKVEAIKWYKKACEQRHIDACDTLKEIQ